MKYFFILFLIPVYTLAAPPNAGSLMQNAKKQIDYQTLTNPIIKNTETIDEQLSPIKSIDESDDHNRSSSKQVEPIKLKITKREQKKEIYEPKVLVKNFKITGNTMLSTAMLESSLDSFKNKRLTFKQIQIAIGSISNKYRSEGYTARTLLPPQEVINGEIKVVVLEGNLSGIDIDSTNLQRFTPSQAKAIIENTHPVGEKLQTKNLERALLILGDTPGIALSSSLVAGEKAGDSKLKVKLEDASFYDVFVSYANGGAKSTGSDMLTISSSLNSPFSMGEQITLQGMLSEGIKYIGGGFSYPILYNGLKIGFDASAMRYDVVEDIEADGEAQTIGTWISYPIIRSPRTNLNITLKYDKKYYLNRVLETIVSDKNIQGVSVILDGSHYDSMGQTNIRATFTRSKLDLTDVETDYLIDQATAEKNGSFSKLYLNIYRAQKLSDSAFLLLTANLQKSNKNLDSAEKLYLGGPSGVRAYPSNEAGGDEGYILNAEIVQNFTYALSGGIFYDLGEVKQHKILYEGWQGSSSVENSYKLRGAGVNLSYNYDTWSAKVTMAFKHGDNPNPQVDGSDNDGTNKSPRFWFQLAKVF